MSVGFIMLAHAALHRAAQVASAVSEAGCPMIVHVDARVGAPYDPFAKRIAGLPGVEVSQRVVCEWGTWSLVDASRTAAEKLLARHPDLTHIYLISGACLPIKPIPKLVEFLGNHPDTDFIESVTIEDVPWTKGGLSEERFSLTFPFAWRRHRRLFDIWVETQRLVRRKRRIPQGLTPHMGSQWWCLTRATLQKIIEDPRRGQLDRYFKRVWIPDESYFQTLVRLYGSKVESRSLTLSKFDFQGKPHVFYDDHLVLLRQSSAFFARKIWPGANRLYRVFLESRRVPPQVALTTPAHIERTFAQATTRRTKGRPGMVMASRFPSLEHETVPTAAPYSVFHGFSDIFAEFPKWVRRHTGSRAHGHLFCKDRVEFFGGQTGYAGALSDGAALRDYDPDQFLRNLIWNTRGEHQSFLNSPRDTQKIGSFLARDSNATIAIISGAWVLPLLRSKQPIDVIRKEAARLQKREADFIELLGERRARARTRMWTLAEFLERPLDPLQETVDSLSGVDSNMLVDMPEAKPLIGLADFLQSLRNSGMNPYLAGEIGEISEDLSTQSRTTGFG